MYQAFTPAPAGTHNNAQGVSGFTRNDMAFMAAMFPAQFGHFAGNPAPSPAVTQLEQAQPIVPAANQQTTQVAAPGPAEEAAPAEQAAPGEVEAPAEDEAPAEEAPRQHQQPRRQPRTSRSSSILDQYSLSSSKRASVYSRQITR